MSCGDLLDTMSITWNVSMDAKSKLPVKKYFDVKVECMLPATLIYRILAENPEEAATLAKRVQPTSVQHKLSGRKELKLTVYDAGSNMIRLIKNLFGR
jgi:hypothetical protein